MLEKYIIDNPEYTVDKVFSCIITLEGGQNFTCDVFGFEVASALSKIDRSIDAAQLIELEKEYGLDELREIILDNAIQLAAETKLYQTPSNSPWGPVQDAEVLFPGIFRVSTASHGGIMCLKGPDEILSEKARKIGDHSFSREFTCYEEDIDAMIPLYELAVQSLWKPSASVEITDEWKAAMKNEIAKWYPEYLYEE